MVLILLAWIMMAVEYSRSSKYRIPEEEHDSEGKTMHSVLDTLSSECELMQESYVVQFFVIHTDLALNSQGYE